MRVKSIDARVKNLYLEPLDYIPLLPTSPGYPLGNVTVFGNFEEVLGIRVIFTNGTKTMNSTSLPCHAYMRHRHMSESYGLLKIKKIL